MQVGYLDRDSRSCCHPLTVGHIPTGAEDMQGFKRKEGGPISVDRAARSEHPTLYKGLNLIDQKKRGEEKNALLFFMCHVIYAIMFYNLNSCALHIFYSFLFKVQ